MRDYSLQTPQKDHSATKLRSKSTSVHNKKPAKVTPKSLSSAFSEDSLKYSTDSPSITEVSDEDVLAESFEEIPEVLVSPISVPANPTTVFSSETTPCSSVITCDVSKDGAASSTTQSQTGRQEITTLSSTVDAEEVLNCLREVRLQASKVKKGSLSKNLLDTLLNIDAEEILLSPAEKDWFDVILSNKGYTTVLCFLLWTIVVLVVVFNSSRSKVFYPDGLIPT